MNGKTLLDNMSEINLTYVEEAVFPQKKILRVHNPVVVAACLLIIIGTYVGTNNRDKVSISKDNVVPEVIEDLSPLNSLILLLILVAIYLRTSSSSERLHCSARFFTMVSLAS